MATIVCTVVLVVGALICVQYIPSPFHLEISETKWVVPNEGRKQVEFHVYAPGPPANYETNARWGFGGIILFDEQRSGYTIFPGSFLAPESMTSDSKTGRVDIKVVGYLLKDESGKRFLSIGGANNYSLPEEGQYGVFAYFGNYENGDKRSNYVYVDVSDQ